MHKLQSKGICCQKSKPAIGAEKWGVNSFHDSIRALLDQTQAHLVQVLVFHSSPPDALGAHRTISYLHPAASNLYQARGRWKGRGRWKKNCHSQPIQMSETNSFLADMMSDQLITGHTFQTIHF